MLLCIFWYDRYKNRYEIIDMCVDSYQYFLYMYDTYIYDIIYEYIWYNEITIEDNRRKTEKI